MTVPTSRARLSAATALAKRALHTSGYYGYRLQRAPFPGLAVLCFHAVVGPGAQVLPFRDLHVTVAAFDRLCSTLSRYCTPVSLGDVVAACDAARPLPPRAVLVTFDDGYRSVVTRALPALERHRVPAVVFVCTDAIDRGELFWYDRAWLDEHGGAQAAAAEMAPMTPAQLRQLAAHPLVDLGGHTRSHPILAQTSRAAQQAEIVEGRDRLEQLAGCGVVAFAYPFGLPGRDYTDEAVALVRDAGFACAFSTREAFASPAGDRWQIPRFVMLDSTGPAEFLHRLAHSWPRGDV